MKLSLEKNLQVVDDADLVRVLALAHEAISLLLPLSLVPNRYWSPLRSKPTDRELLIETWSGKRQ